MWLRNALEAEVIDYEEKEYEFSLHQIYYLGIGKAEYRIAKISPKPESKYQRIYYEVVRYKHPSQRGWAFGSIYYSIKEIEDHYPTLRGIVGMLF